MSPKATASRPAPDNTAARPAPHSGKTTSTLLMLVASALLITLLFPPFYCFFLAPVALVPFAVCILRRPVNKRHLLLYYALGFLFFMPNLFWLWPVTFPGVLCLALFLACYFPLFAFAFHRLVVQFRMPATVALPLAWVAVEYLRASFVLGGFPWFLLGNSLAAAPFFLQPADLFGVWGLSFLIALLNGYFVDLLRLPLRQAGRFSPAISSLTGLIAVTLALSAAYSFYRLHQSTTREGPRVAVIQHNLSQSNKDDSSKSDNTLQIHLDLATRAASTPPPRPDLIVWPETMVPYYINDSFIKGDPNVMTTYGKEWSNRKLVTDYQDLCAYAKKLVLDLSDSFKTPQLIGYGTFDPGPSFNQSAKQNRTGLVLPGKGIVDEYAKVHLVPFGETIPFKDVPLIGGLVRFLTPYDTDYSNIPGTRWTRFQLPTASGTYTFATPICFEDTMPYPSRYMSAPQLDEHGQNKKTDFLVNVSNDGWFHWVEIEQRMQASQLRAVENRISIARSVNTGNSGFIDSNGRVMGLVTDPTTHSSIHAVGTLAMNLPIDSRVTLFSRIGDLLPLLCGILTTLFVGWTVVRPRRGILSAPKNPGDELN